MPMESLLDPTSPSMYALMIFFSISAIGMIMAVKTRYRRLNNYDDIHDVINHDKKLQERHTGNIPTQQPTDEEYKAMGKNARKSIDDLLDNIKEEKDDQ